MSAGELNLNAIYAKHPALKSVYEKSQSVMGGKLFSSYSPIGQCLNLHKAFDIPKQMA